MRIELDLFIDPSNDRGVFVFPPLFLDQPFHIFFAIPGVAYRWLLQLGTGPKFSSHMYVMLVLVGEGF